MAKSHLPPAQERFCQEYLLDLNTTAAYQRAYPKSTARSARASGSELLAKPNIQARVAELMAKRAQRVELSQDRIVHEIMAIAFSQIRRVAHWDADGIHLHESAALAPEDAAAIQEVSETQEGKLRVKLYNKLEALVTLGKHLGMFTERLQITGRDGLPLIPVQTVQAAIRDALGGETPPAWMEGLVSAEEMRVLFPGAFQPTGEVEP